MMQGRRPAMFAAAFCACLILLADQASKHWVTTRLFPCPDGPVGPSCLPDAPGVGVTDFFNLILTWNYGVSFGILNLGHDAMAPVLSAAAGVICALVLWFAWVEPSRWVGLGAGLVVGGALGNVIDRLRFGAVVDFLDFHWQGWHWPAFNLADAAIVIGAGLIFVDAGFTTGQQRSDDGPSAPSP
jgi:signal peptidase II